MAEKVMYMLIDVTDADAEHPTIRITKKAPLTEIILWGRLAKADNRDVVGPPIEGRSFAKFDHKQLSYLLWNTFGESPANLDYPELLLRCKELALALPPDDTPRLDLESLVLSTCDVIYDRGTGRIKTNHETKEEVGQPAARKARQTSSGPAKRPKAGTTTGAVWDICDELAAKHGREPTRQEVMAQCEYDGINKATGSTQFGKWRGAKKALTEGQA